MESKYDSFFLLFLISNAYTVNDKKWFLNMKLQLSYLTVGICFSEVPYLHNNLHIMVVLHKSLYLVLTHYYQNLTSVGS